LLFYCQCSRLVGIRMGGGEQLGDRLVCTGVEQDDREREVWRQCPSLAVSPASG